MPAVWHAPHGPATADGLVVFLPGFGDGPEAFVEHGFVDRVLQAEGGRFDAVCADAHAGYYFDGFQVLERLAADVIGPARDAGYRRIWLVGISMGGFGVMHYARAHPDQITGVVGLAPYLGERGVIEEVRDAGGLASWSPPVARISAMDEGRERASYELWQFFQSYVDTPTGPDLWLGWGRDDGLHVPAAEVAAVLPANHHATLPGGHTWTVWEPLFAELLPRALAAR